MSSTDDLPGAARPRYPVYVISKGRWNCGLTANFLIADGVDFRLVVEPQEREAYASVYGDERLYVLPFSNLGLGSIPARNWVWNHAESAGHFRHWILDDNIRCVMRRYKGQRMYCQSGPALAACEDFVDRYENVAVAGLNYAMFALETESFPPFYLNNHVYSCLLIRNDLAQRWRGHYNEDTDLCLQVLSAGWCTILFNAFLIVKRPTMTMKGGNTDELYRGDGRLRMARSLERMWPGVVRTGRRFKRPQHIVRDSWRSFDTPLRLKPDADSARRDDSEYGLKLTAVAEVKSQKLRDLLKSSST